MKNKWKSIRLGAMLFALPVVATAAASANQWMIENAPMAISTELSASFDTINAKRNHTISLNESGNVEGRIATIEAGSKANGLSDLNVFLISNGEVKHETKSDSDGLFSLAGVDAGVYSFVATGENGFAAYGVRVVEDGVDSSINLIEAAAVSPNTSVVKQLMGGELPTKVAAAVLENATVSETASNTVGSNKVTIENGTLVGHVIPMLGDVSAANGTSVYIIKDNQQVAEAQTDASGSFSVDDLEPGVYDFVAAGPTGFAAVSFEAVQQGNVASVVADSDEIPVSAEPAAVAYQDFVDYGDASSSLDVCTTCQADTGFATDEIVYGGDEVVYGGDEVYYGDSAPIEYAGESVGCGCASGGSCGAVENFSGFNSCNACNAGASRGGLFSRLGGGGGGGLFGGSGGGLLGGSGFARLALLGAAVAIPVAITAGDDDDPVPPTASGFTTLQ